LTAFFAPNCGSWLLQLVHVIVLTKEEKKQEDNAINSFLGACLRAKEIKNTP